MTGKRSTKSRKGKISEEQMRQYNYIAAKNGWLARHPHATPQQIEAAMLEIARKTGV